MRKAAAALIVLATACPAAAARPDGEARLARLLAGRVPQAPIDCISLSRSNGSVTVPRTAIVYQQAGTYYVNRFANGCDQLDSDTFIVTRTPSTQLCRGDIAEVRQTAPAIPRGSCVFASFTPYVRAPK